MSCINTPGDGERQSELGDFVPVNYEGRLTNMLGEDVPVLPEPPTAKRVRLARELLSAVQENARAEGWLFTAPADRPASMAILARDGDVIFVLLTGQGRLTAAQRSWQASLIGSSARVITLSPKGVETLRKTLAAKPKPSLASLEERVEMLWEHVHGVNTRCCRRKPESV